MSWTDLEVFDETVPKTNAWLKDLHAGVYQALRAAPAVKRSLKSDEGIRSREKLLAQISTRLPNRSRAVFQVLESHVSPGEIRAVIRVLWPDTRSGS